MRKLLLIIAFFLSLIGYSQTLPITTVNNIKINGAVEGDGSDSLVVFGSDKILRFLPKSESGLASEAYVDEIVATKGVLQFDYIQADRNPILSVSVGEWDAVFREIGNRIVEAGTIYVCYTGVNGTVGVDSRIGLAKSTDGGVTFTKVGMIADTPAEDPYIIKVGSTYYCYSEESSDNPKKIQLHTATDLEGVWTYQGIVLNYPSDTSWYGDSIGSPLPYYDEETGQFVLFFEGLCLAYRQLGAIGYATSMDGESFTINPEPIIVGNTFATLYPSVDISDALIIEWGKVTVPDDIRKYNGVFYMSMHANASPFRAGLVRSLNLLGDYQDMLNTFASNSLDTTQDIMFVDGVDLGCMMIDDSAENIYNCRFTIKNDYVIVDKPIETNSDITTSGTLNIDGALNASGLVVAETDALATTAGVELSELYVDEFNLLRRRTSLVNLFANSEPTADEGLASNITYESYAWGYGGFTTAVRINGGGSPRRWYGASVVSGRTYNLSFYVIMDDGSIPVVGETSSQPNSDFGLVMNGTVASGFSNLTTENVSGNIYRVSGYKVATGTSTTQIGISQSSSNSGKAFRVTGFQLTEGQDLSEYQKTPVTPPTLDDGLLFFNGSDVVQKEVVTTLDTSANIPTSNTVKTYVDSADALKANINNAVHTGTFTIASGIVNGSPASNQYYKTDGNIGTLPTDVRGVTIGSNTGSDTTIISGNSFQTAVWNLQAQVNSRVKLTGGNTITGTQDLTGAVTNVATPTTANNATTKAYVDGLNASINAYVAKTASYTLTDADGVVDLTSGTATFTLPTAVGRTGKQFVVKNSGAGILTLDTTGAQTIDGMTTKTYSTQYSGARVVSNGSNWAIISLF